MTDKEFCRPRRSGRVKKPSRAIQSQQEKIELGLILVPEPRPGFKCKEEEEHRGFAVEG